MSPGAIGPGDGAQSTPFPLPPSQDVFLDSSTLHRALPHGPASTRWHGGSLWGQACFRARSNSHRLQDQSECVTLCP